MSPDFSDPPNDPGDPVPTEQWDVLIRRAKDGCEQSFEEIFEQVYNYLILTAGTRMGDGLRGKVGASDIVQSGLIRAYGALDKFEGSTEAEFRAWVKTIVLNSLHDQTRRYESQKRRVDREHGLGDITLTGGISPSDIASQNEEKILLQRYVSRLPALEQRVVEMRHRFGYSLTDIADILGISYSQVRTALKGGIAKLKVWIKEREHSTS